MESRHDLDKILSMTKQLSIEIENLKEDQANSQSNASDIASMQAKLDQSNLHLEETKRELQFYKNQSVKANQLAGDEIDHAAAKNQFASDFNMKVSEYQIQLQQTEMNLLHHVSELQASVSDFDLETSQRFLAEIDTLKTNIEQAYQEFNQNLVNNQNTMNSMINYQYDSIAVPAEAIQEEQPSNVQVDAKQAVAQNHQVEDFTVASAQPQTEVDPQIEANSKATSNANLELLVGTKIFSILGSIVLVVSLVLFGKYSYDNIAFLRTDEFRLGFTYGFGIVALLVGHFLHRRNKFEYLAESMTGLGIAAAFIATALGYFSFGTFSDLVAIVIIITLSIGSLALAFFYKSQVTACIAFIGSYSALFGFSDSATGFILYLTCISITQAVINRLKDWKVSTFLNFILFLASLLSLFIILLTGTAGLSPLFFIALLLVNLVVNLVSITQININSNEYHLSVGLGYSILMVIASEYMLEIFKVKDTFSTILIIFACIYILLAEYSKDKKIIIQKLYYIIALSLAFFAIISEVSGIGLNYVILMHFTIVSIINNRKISRITSTTQVIIGIILAFSASVMQFETSFFSSYYDWPEYLEPIIFLVSVAIALLFIIHDYNKQSHDPFSALYKENKIFNSIVAYYTWSYILFTIITAFIHYQFNVTLRSSFGFRLDDLYIFSMTAIALMVYIFFLFRKSKGLNLPFKLALASWASLIVLTLNYFIGSIDTVGFAFIFTLGINSALLFITWKLETEAMRAYQGSTYLATHIFILVSILMNLSGIAVNIFLIIMSVIAIVIGFYKRISSMRRFGLGLTIITIIYITLSGIQYLDDLAKIVSLFVSGLAILLVSWLYYVFTHKIIGGEDNGNN